MTITRTLRHVSVVAAVTAGLLLFATACSSSGNSSASATGGTSAHIGTVRVATVDPSPEATLPGQTTTTNMFPIRGTVYESLIGYDPVTGNYTKPSLATSWKSNAAGTVWTFKLRHGVQFQRGAGELTSADVKFSEELVAAPDSLATDGPYYRSTVKSIDTPDKYTVVFNLNSPNAFAEKQVIWDTNLFITSESYYKKVGAAKAAAQPVGTGPYVLDKYTPGQGMDFSLSKNYWGKEPQYKHLDIKFVSDDQTRVNMLLAGEVDAAEVPRVSIAQLKGGGLKVASPASSTVSVSLLFGSGYLPNSGGEPWSNEKVREALNLGIDRNSLVKGVLLGYGDNAASNLVGPKTPGFAQMKRNPYPYDPTKAKKLLQEAGYGKGLSIDVKVVPIPGIPEIDDLVQAAASQLSKIGVTLNIQDSDAAPLTDLFRGRKPTPFLLTARTPYNAYDPDSLFDLQFGKDGAWAAGSSMSGLQPLVAATASAITPAQKAKAFAAAAQAVYDSYWNVPLIAAKGAVAYNPAVVGGWTGTLGYGFDGLTTFTQPKS